MYAAICHSYSNRLLGIGKRDLGGGIFYFVLFCFVAEMGRPIADVFASEARIVEAVRDFLRAHEPMATEDPKVLDEHMRLCNDEFGGLELSYSVTEVDYIVWYLLHVSVLNVEVFFSDWQPLPGSKYDIWTRMLRMHRTDSDGWNQLRDIVSGGRWRFIYIMKTAVCEPPV